MAYSKISVFFAKLSDSLRHRKEIDVILTQSPPTNSSLKTRTHWLFDLINWIRREGYAAHDLDFATGVPQAARVRYLLQVLDRNLEWKKRTAQTLRSIIKDSKGLELFIEIGLFSQDHFLGELSGRMNEKWLPQVPRDRELSYIFSQNFHDQEDFEWIHLMDNTTFARIVELFHFEVSAEEEAWNSLKSDCEQAILLLALQVQGLGLSTDLRKRVTDSHFENSAFYQLPDYVEKFITEPDLAQRQVLAAVVAKKIMDCQNTLLEVQQYLDQHGVSIQIVFKIERLEHLLKRISDLVILLQSNPVNTVMLSQFLENLIAENIKKRSLVNFFNQIFALLSRKIVERNGETGEHYITRNPKQYLTLIKSAIGGGIITSLTALLKLILHHVPFEPFFGGVVASLNYSISFLAIHFCHFTLGTKQPSSTAPALAAKMDSIEDPDALANLTDEIVHTIRSQFAAIFGNVLGVVPVTLFLCWVLSNLFTAPLLTAEDALYTMKSFSIIGMTPIYAAFTGFLLWVSSLFSGWIENWFTYHQIAPALAANRRMIFVMGPLRAKTFSLFLKRNILGIASSISLGFLLGLFPVVLQFLGIQIEVRHVTLSSGALTAALYSLPTAMVDSWDFWLAVCGVASMGIINVSVAFSLALLLAVKARHIHAPKRKLIYSSVLRKLYSRPQDFVWPRPKSTP